MTFVNSKLIKKNEIFKKNVFEISFHITKWTKNIIEIIVMEGLSWRGYHRGVVMEVFSWRGCHGRVVMEGL